MEQHPNYEKGRYNLGNAIYQQEERYKAIPLYELISKNYGDQTE
ncbi:MAG: hypothetical protein R2821_01795 [Flavobacteriaceae bacterium]